jgi:hypothetical protein
MDYFYRGHDGCDELVGELEAVDKGEAAAYRSHHIHWQLLGVGGVVKHGGHKSSNANAKKKKKEEANLKKV